MFVKVRDGIVFIALQLLLGPSAREELQLPGITAERGVSVFVVPKKDLHSVHHLHTRGLNLRVCIIGKTHLKYPRQKRFKSLALYEEHEYKMFRY